MQNILFTIIYLSFNSRTKHFLLRENTKQYETVILVLFIINRHFISHKQKVQIQNIVYCYCKLERILETYNKDTSS